MSDVISEYQRWKEQGEELRTKARQAMESRFRELLSEAVRLAEEYRADFGMPLKPPPAVTAFRFRSGAKKARKEKAAAKPPAPEPKVEPPPAAKRDPKVAALERRLVTARKKLEAARASGAPTKNLEDKVYEIEDDLRLSSRVQ
jgi:hypothetical protein